MSEIKPRLAPAAPKIRARALSYASTRACTRKHAAGKIPYLRWAQERYADGHCVRDVWRHAQRKQHLRKRGYRCPDTYVLCDDGLWYKNPAWDGPGWELDTFGTHYDLALHVKGASPPPEFVGAAGDPIAWYWINQHTKQGDIHTLWGRIVRPAAVPECHDGALMIAPKYGVRLGHETPEPKDNPWQELDFDDEGFTLDFADMLELAKHVDQDANDNMTVILQLADMVDFSLPEIIADCDGDLRIIARTLVVTGYLIGHRIALRGK